MGLPAAPPLATRCVAARSVVKMQRSYSKLAVVVTIDAPETGIHLAAGDGPHASWGTFLNPAGGVQGVSLSLGPSFGPPVNGSVEVGNVCSWAN